jgi:hypothetical protein
MTTNTIFNFEATVRYSYKLKENTFFHLEKITESIARLYFTDEHNSLIEKPTIFHLESYKYDGDDIEYVMEKYIDNNYYLCWSDSYSITYDQIVIMTIDSQRTWNIHNVNNVNK